MLMARCVEKCWVSYELSRILHVYGNVTWSSGFAILLRDVRNYYMFIKD